MLLLIFYLYARLRSGTIITMRDISVSLSKTRAFKLNVDRVQRVFWYGVLFPQEVTSEIFQRHVQSARSFFRLLCSLVRRIIKERRTTDVPEAVVAVVVVVDVPVVSTKSNRSGHSREVASQFYPDSHLPSSRSI